MPPEASDKCCVLLVDDDPDTRTMYALGLRLAQFDVLESGDGASALSTASERLPDVIVTDLSGPNLDGFELLDWLRANPKTARIRAIVLTGRTDAATAARARALRAQFLVKPCLPDTLILHVLRALANVAA